MQNVSMKVLIEKLLFSWYSAKYLLPVATWSINLSPEEKPILEAENICTTPIEFRVGQKFFDWFFKLIVNYCFL